MQAELPTRTRPPYRRLLTLASGGMGRVDLSSRREGRFERLYAVKHLHAHVREDAEIRAMFLDEARIAGLLRHPNVVSVLDVGEDEEGPFLVMDYVDGMPLTSLIKRANETGTALPLEVALGIGIDVARGLAAAHDLRDSDGQPLGLVHRDVSPHNVLVGFDGVARVTDFGIAKVLGRQSARTSTGILKGKLGYMSPEQLRFLPPDRRSDLFSFGIVLYELLAGRRLYPGSDGESSARRILEEPPPDLADARDDAPPSLVGLLFALLAKDPVDRPVDGHAVEHALEDMLADLGLPATTTAVRAHMQSSFEGERTQRQAALRAAQSDRPLNVEPSRASRAPAADAETRAASAPARTSRARARWSAVALVLSALALIVVGATVAGTPPHSPSAHDPPAPSAENPAEPAPTLSPPAIEREPPAGTERARPLGETVEPQIEATRSSPTEPGDEEDGEPVGGAATTRPTSSARRAARAPRVTTTSSDEDTRRARPTGGLRTWDWTDDEPQ